MKNLGLGRLNIYPELQKYYVLESGFQLEQSEISQT
jgi:hypothetical protein